jgi:hypothetical protein
MEPQYHYRAEELMIERMLLVYCISLGAILIGGHAVQAQASLPNLSGTYNCTPEPRPCQSPTFTVTQMGNKLEVKSAQGDVGGGEVTSNISAALGPPWNSLGTILPDQRTIEWSGTRWQKQ